MAEAAAQQAVDHVRGRITDQTPAEDQTPGTLVLHLDGSDYRLLLVADGPVDTDAHGQAQGRIHAQAQRVDVVRSGGRFIEPVYGRPRRIQGRIVAVDQGRGTITVRAGAGCPFICRLTAPGQSPQQFQPGQIVGFDILRGARFEPI